MCINTLPKDPTTRLKALKALLKSKGIHTLKESMSNQGFIDTMRTFCKEWKISVVVIRPEIHQVYRPASSFYIKFMHDDKDNFVSHYPSFKN